MAYNIIRNTRTEYVSMVEKGRDSRGNVKTISYICGLGSMSVEAFKRFQAWAHDIKNQEARKAAVLNCKLAVTDNTTKESRKAVKSKIEPVVKGAKKFETKHEEPAKMERKKYVKPQIKTRAIIKAEPLTEAQIKRKALKEKEDKKRERQIKKAEKGMSLPARATWRKKYAIINKQISHIKRDIKAKETEKRIAAYSYHGATKTRKVAEHNQYIETAQEAIERLKRQKAGLR